MRRVAQIGLVGAGILTLAVAGGFCFGLPAATALWPWPDGRLSYLLIGSILAAAGAAMAWIGFSGELAALPAGSLNILVISLGASVFFLGQGFAAGRSKLLPFGILSFLVALASAVALYWSRTIPLSESMPSPRFVRFSFGVFMAALLAAGSALLFRLPIFPWALNPDSSVLFGCIFIGDAMYFAYGLFLPRWQNAKGQLLSFLVYDLVLVGPFLGLLGTIKPAFRLSLTVYLAVLFYSGVVAAYYLFIHSPTRRWQPEGKS